MVKKTAGGPSGSLTSEGTEYDESSGDEAVQEESKVPEPSGSFPAPQQAFHHKATKPSSVGRGGGSAVTTPESSARAQSAKFTPTNFQRLSSSEQLGAPQDAMPIIKHNDSTPYLDPQIPRGASSQPQDDWPIIPAEEHREILQERKEIVPQVSIFAEEHKEVAPQISMSAIPIFTTKEHKDMVPQVSHSTIPLHNTMIYNAVMSTNRNNNPDQAPVSSSSYPHLPYSTAPADKARFPSSFGSQHIMAPCITSASATFPPHTISSPGLHVTPLAGQSPGLLPANFPMQDQHISPVHAQFQSSQARTTSLPSSPLGYGVLRGNRYSASSEIYSMAMIPRASSGLQVGTYNRSPRMNEASVSVPLPYTTMTAGIEMRTMLGIDGRQPTNLPALVTNGSFHLAGSTGSAFPQPVPSTRESGVQTQPPAGSEDQEVQVGPEMTTQCVQVDPLRSAAETQTSGLFVPVEDLEPAQNVQMETLGKHTWPAILVFTMGRVGYNMVQATKLGHTVYTVTMQGLLPCRVVTGLVHAKTRLSI